MKALVLLILAATGLAGCVVVPYADGPAVYAPPPAASVVVRPYGYYGGPRYRRWRY